MTVPKQEGSYCKGDANVVYELGVYNFSGGQIGTATQIPKHKSYAGSLGKRVIAQIISSVSESQLCFTALFIAKVVEQPEYTGV